MNNFKYILLILTLLSLANPLVAKERVSSRFQMEVDFTTFSFKNKPDYYISVKAGALFNNNLFLGGGVGYTNDHILVYGPNPGRLESVPMIANIRYGLPITKTISLLSSTDICYNIYTRNDYINRFYVLPKIGVGVNVTKKSSINLYFAFRYNESNYNRYCGCCLSYSF